MNIRIFDNGGETADRYTVAYMDQQHPRTGTVDMVGMCNNPYHPLGFGQHGEVALAWVNDTNKTDVEITFDQLPEPCQRVVLNDLS